MKLHRNEQGLLRGDLQYDVGFPATVKPEIAPVVYPCANCGTLTFHVVVEQPTGLGIKLPFARKPLATTGKDYGLVCNSCTSTTGITGRHLIEMLERRVVPRDICAAIDRFLEGIPNVPNAYAEGFTAFMAQQFEGESDLVATFVSVYSRGQKGPLNSVGLLAFPPTEATGPVAERDVWVGFFPRGRVAAKAPWLVRVGLTRQTC
jgi:hypothetical protein